HRFTPSPPPPPIPTRRSSDLTAGAATASQSITVNNVAPTASIVGAPASSSEGTLISLTSNVVDPGTADTFSYAWLVTKNGNAYIDRKSTRLNSSHLGISYAVF